MSGNIQAKSLFFRGRRKRVKYTQLCDVDQRTTNAIPLWDLVEMQLGMLVDSNCDDPLAHCAAQGYTSGDVGQLRLYVSWATHQDVKARSQQLVCMDALEAFTPLARGYLTQYSAERW